MNTSCDWENIFLQYRKCTRDTKVLDFQYKFIHKIIYTKRELLKMKLVDSDTCVSRGLTSEDMYHVYVYCPDVNDFWKEFSHFIKSTINKKFHLSDTDILFCCNTTLHKPHDSVGKAPHLCYEYKVS